MKNKIVSIVLALVLSLFCLSPAVMAAGMNRGKISEKEKNTTIGLFAYMGADGAVDILQNGNFHSYVDAGNPDDATSLSNFATSLLFADLGNEYVSQTVSHKVLYLTDETLARAEANADYLMGYYDEKEESGGVFLPNDLDSVSFFFPVPALEEAGMDNALENYRKTLELYGHLVFRYKETVFQESFSMLKNRTLIDYPYLGWAYNTREGSILSENLDENGQPAENGKTNDLVYCLGESNRISHGTARTSYDYRLILTDYYKNVLGFPHENHTWARRPAFYGRNSEGKYRQISPAYTFCLSCGAVKQ